MKLKTITLLLLLFGFSIKPVFTIAQPSLSKKDAEFINQTAEKRVSTLARYLEMIGATYLESNEKMKIIQTQIPEIVDPTAIFTNDLDPTNKTPDDFIVTEYFKNISIFYQDHEGVSIRFEQINNNGDIYYNQKEKLFFSKVKVTRKLKGNYFNNGEPIPNSNSMDLDFFINVDPKKATNDIKIISMSFHKPISGLKKVEIKKEGRSLFSSEEITALQKELDRQKTDVESWKNKAESAQLRAEAARREAELAKRELSLKKSELHNAQKKAEHEKRERELAEREQKVLEAMAERNRIVLKLGGGMGFLPIAENHEAYNVEGKSSLRNYHLTGSLNYRLGSVKKLKKANRGTSLSFFYTRDYLNDNATAFFLNTFETNLAVVGRSTTSEFQGGFVFRQNLRLSAGIGEINYSINIVENNTTVKLNVQDNYRVYTLGLISPSLKNTILLYANLRLFQLTFPAGKEDDYLRANLEFGLKLQIQ